MKTEEQYKNLKNNTVNLELLQENGLNDPYYTQPYTYITEKMNLQLNCTGSEFQFAVEMANDEDITPVDSSIEVIADGVLAYLYSDLLEKAGISLLAYFTYRFHPPSYDFQVKLNNFESLLRSELT